MPMRVFYSTEEWKAGLPEQRAVLSIGNFDGLHLGHRQILNAVVQRARAAAQVAGVVTFDPHPMKVLRPESAPPLIQTPAQRLSGFERADLDAVLVLRFDQVLSRLAPEQFVQDILVNGLRVGAVLVGENFRFGHRQAGNVQLLRQAGARFDFDVQIVPPVSDAGEVVSSTAVRNAVRDGDVLRAARLLGRPFALTGEIRRGAGRGRTLLFPTLNLAPQQELLPRTGVYVTETLLGEKAYRSATNVGTRPTVDGSSLKVESHLFDFSDQGRDGGMEVRFLHRLRDEQKFDSVDDLRAQIARDLQAAQEFFRLHK